MPWEAQLHLPVRPGSLSGGSLPPPPLGVHGLSGSPFSISSPAPSPPSLPARSAVLLSKASALPAWPPHKDPGPGWVSSPPGLSLLPRTFPFSSKRAGNSLQWKKESVLLDLVTTFSNRCVILSPFCKPLVAQALQDLPPVQEPWAPSLGRDDPLEEGTAGHCSALAWRVPRTEVPGGLRFVGLQRRKRDTVTESCLFLPPSFSLENSLESTIIWLSTPALPQDFSC